MSNIFIISDTHWNHANTWQLFKQADGVTPLRPFASTEEMNEAMVDNWNKVVRPEDKVYHLGDVAFSLTGLSFLGRCNGTKVLIKGNHDNLKLSQYMQFFKDIRAYHQLERLVLSHVPIHTESLARWSGNVHGHLHSYRVLHDGMVDSRYFNASVEQINYTPISFEDVKKQF